MRSLGAVGRRRDGTDTTVDGDGRHLSAVLADGVRPEQAQSAGAHSERPTRRTGSLPTASPRDQVGFNALVVLPNVVQGLFRRRPIPVRLAGWLNVDRLGMQVIGRIRDRASAGAVWLRVLGDRSVLVLDAADVRHVLEASPHPFASDPPVKRRGMSHFQPNALTLSRDRLWQERRQFTESVLDTAEPRHRFADRFAVVAREEIEVMLAAAGSSLRWPAWEAAFRRIARRVVLGDSATDDEHVTDLLYTLMGEANRLPAVSSVQLERLLARLTGYTQPAESGSLVFCAAQAPSGPDTDVPGQLPQWLFAIGDTLAINAFRALALIATHPAHHPSNGAVDTDGSSSYLRACLEEAMRLWPTTPLFGRVTVEDVVWAGERIPAGTPILISNSFNHRDEARHDAAHRFDPDTWFHGDGDTDWSLNHFSNGPQACPGAGIARSLGAEVLGAMLADTRPRLRRPRLDPNRPLPAMLDHFRLQFELAPSP